jgi:hypothetical protein
MSDWLLHALLWDVQHRQCCKAFKVAGVNKAPMPVQNTTMHVTAGSYSIGCLPHFPCNHHNSAPNGPFGRYAQISNVAIIMMICCCAGGAAAPGDSPASRTGCENMVKEETGLHVCIAAFAVRRTTAHWWTFRHKTTVLWFR